MCPPGEFRSEALPSEDCLSFRADVSAAAAAVTFRAERYPD